VVFVAVSPDVAVHDNWVCLLLKLLEVVVVSVVVVLMVLVVKGLGVAQFMTYVLVVIVIGKDTLVVVGGLYMIPFKNIKCLPEIPYDCEKIES
jgi:hypothetical protein